MIHITYSRARRVVFWLLLTFSPSIASPQAPPQLPDFGDPSGSILSAQLERELGEEIMRQIRSQGALIQDTQIQEYVRNLGQRLRAGADSYTHEITFFAIDDPAVNAFALPGGFIGINTGLITASRSEAGLASVIAHEIAHVTQRHLARSFSLASNLTLPTLAAIVAGILIGGEVGIAAAMAAQAGATQVQINFTRQNEQEADRVGMQVLARSGFDPRAMASMFETLQQSSRYYGEGPPEFLRTHPLDANRIAEARDRAERYRRRPLKDSFLYHLTRARIAVVGARSMNKYVQAAKARLAAGKYRNEEAERYGYALALNQTGKQAQARNEITTLLKKRPDEPAYLIAMAEIEAAAGRFDRAIKLLRPHQRDYPNHHSLALTLAEIQILGGQPADAVKTLSDHLEFRASDPDTWLMLARAQRAQQRRGPAHKSLGQYHFLLGNYKAAIYQLELALKDRTIDDYESARIEARLKVLRALLKQRQAELAKHE
ncbi:MAG: M48 family metallopeptidase [Gammaproteobacteria bacterium]|nr:MAG: M48 family metallopeptidase [Gammaproteobacteria bacterium]